MHTGYIAHTMIEVKSREADGRRVAYLQDLCGERSRLPSHILGHRSTRDVEQKLCPSYSARSVTYEDD